MEFHFLTFCEFGVLVKGFIFYPKFYIFVDDDNNYNMRLYFCYFCTEGALVCV
jgi:hypothetical protein